MQYWLCVCVLLTVWALTEIDILFSTCSMWCMIIRSQFVMLKYFLFLKFYTMGSPVSVLLFSYCGSVSLIIALVGLLRCILKSKLLYD
jgi:hypothetical protein